MRSEPLINTPNMKSMVTLREQPEFVAGSKVRQANNALTIHPGEVELRGELNNSKALDGFLVNSGRGSGGGRGRTVVVGDDNSRAFKNASDDGVEA